MRFHRWVAVATVVWSRLERPRAAAGSFPSRGRPGRSARPAHHVPEHDREPGAPASVAPDQLAIPARARALTSRADQDLAAAEHATRPRALPLVGVVGGPAAQSA